MQADKSQIPGIRFQQSIRQNMGMGFPKQPEIMLSPIGKGQTNDLPILGVHQQLYFQGMTLFLSGIVPLLPFLDVQLAILSRLVDASTRILVFRVTP